MLFTAIHLLATLYMLTSRIVAISRNKTADTMRHHGIQILDAISVLISHASRLLHGFRDDPPFPDDAGRPGLSLSHTIAALVQGHAAALELKFTLDSHTGSHQPHLTRQLFSAGFRAMAFALRGLNHLAADHTAQPQGMMQKLWPRRQDKPKRMSLLQPVRGIFPPSRRWLRYVMATAPISSADAVHRHLSAVTRLNCKCPPFWLHREKERPPSPSMYSWPRSKPSCPPSSTQMTCHC
mmetsp:Transcript_9283/g.22791  ORF Transcript_9283/g.22791 Transcript_9283/m.22791 type:complete len:238 (-) Transcript_9283:279-992(-)